MKGKTIFSLYKKEIIDIIRDKKTILIMILVPIILYPLILLVGLQIGKMIVADSQEKTYTVVMDGIQGEETLKTIMLDGMEDLDYHFQIAESSDPKADLEEKKIDAYITTEQKGEQIEYQIQYISSVNNSAVAASMLEDVIYEYREQLRKTNLEGLQVNVDAILYPIVAEKADQATKEEAMGSVLGSIIPFLLITSILLGAMYPAIDVTAGEKERGTLETLLTLPVSNHELIMSKFLAVATVSCISALLNLLSMGAMGGFLYSSMSGLMTERLSLDFVSFLPAVFITLLCVLVFALFMTALTLCLCIFAKTFKEAQNYSTPLMLVIMFASYVGFLPNVELTATTAIIPVVNICLSIKQLFTFQYDLSIIFMVLFSNIAYSMLAVGVMGRIYDSEGILFGESGSELKLFEKRSNIKKGGMPSTWDAMLLLIICALGNIYIGSYAQMKFGFYGLIVGQSIFLLLPITFVVYTKCDWKKVFSVKIPSALSVIGSIFLWAGTYIMMMVISVPLAKLFPSSMENLEALTELFSNQSVLSLLLVVALLPAICEEILFRGFVFAAIKEKCKPWMAVLAVSVLFGLYHMSLVKFFTTGLLGLVLTYSVYCSQSIVTSMLMHFLNNGVAMGFGFDIEKYGKILPFLNPEQMNVTQNIICSMAALLCIGIGILLLDRVRKQNI